MDSTVYIKLLFNATSSFDMFKLITWLLWFLFLLKDLVDVIGAIFLLFPLLPMYLYNLYLMGHMYGIAGGNDAFGWLFQSSKYFTQISLDIPNILYCFPHLLNPGKSRVIIRYGIPVHIVILLRILKVTWLSQHMLFQFLFWNLGPEDP